MKKRKDNVLSGAGIICLVLSGLCGFVLPGVRFSGVLFFCLAALCGVLLLLERWARTSPTGRVCRRIAWGGICVGLAVFLAVEGMILSYAVNTPRQPLDTIIVLGAGVNGTTPSLTLRTRIQAARAYLEENPETVAVLSGGMGDGENISEALAMRNALVGAGIPESRLILEDQSTNTAENMAFSLEILKKNGINTEETIGIVTNDFHQFRAQRLAADTGFSAVGIPAELPWWWLNANYYVREFFALGKMWLLRLVS